jgi:hypothetical protein
MSFSLRTLLVVVLVAAIFAAALVYRTPMWAVAAVNLTITVLTIGTLGVWMGSFKPRFWLSFCFVGWLYLLIAFTSASLVKLSPMLPGTIVAFQTFFSADELEAMTAEQRSTLEAIFPPSDGSVFWIDLQGGPAAMEALPRFGFYINFVQSLTSLLFAILAGVVASFLLRQ